MASKRKSATKKTASRKTASKRASSSSSGGTEVRGLRAAAESTALAGNRWMVLKRVDESWNPNDKHEEIIDIKVMAPGTVPDLYDLAKGDNEHAGNYSVEIAPPGVQIGMRRGGEFEQVSGFGWVDAADKAANGGNGPGATRLADVGAR